VLPRRGLVAPLIALSSSYLAEPCCLPENSLASVGNDDSDSLLVKRIERSFRCTRSADSALLGFMLWTTQLCRRSLMENWRACPGFASRTVLRDIVKDC